MNYKKLPSGLQPFLVHYYRAEVYRETVWRNRLDVTTNWSIVVTAAMVSFAFSNEGVPHTVIIANYLLVWFFLYAESRRFRYYTLLKTRTRLIEKHVLAPLFEGEVEVKVSEGLQELGQSLEKHQIAMSRLEALAWRARRNYILLMPFLFFVWFVKLSWEADIKASFPHIIARSGVWSIPGPYVFFTFLTSVLFMVLIAFYIPQRSAEDDLP